MTNLKWLPLAHLYHCNEGVDDVLGNMKNSLAFIVMWYPFSCQVGCNNPRINIHILLNAKKRHRNVVVGRSPISLFQGLSLGLYFLPSLLSFVMPTLAVVEAYAVAILFTNIADKADIEFQCRNRRIEIGSQIMQSFRVR